MTRSATSTVYGFNTKPRRQTFLCFWLLLISIFGFTMIMTTNNRSNYLNLYALGLLILGISTFFVMCISMLQIQTLWTNCFFVLIMCSSSILIGYASYQWIDQNCDNNILSSCAAVRFGFDFVYLGITFIIAIDAISHILEKKRIRILLYSLVIFISCILQSIHFYQIPQNDKTIELQTYHANIFIMGIESGLFFIFVGLCGCTHNKCCVCINGVLTITLHLVGLMMLISGTWVFVKEHPNLSNTAMGFFIAHNLLRWAISFCIVVDTKHLGTNVNITESIYAVDDDETMHIKTPTHSARNTKRTKNHDFTQLNNWDIESCTDTDSYLTSTEFSS